MTIIVALGVAAVAFAATRFAVTRLVPVAAIRRVNYRGIAVPTGLGIAVLAGIVVAAAGLALLSEISNDLAVPAAFVLPLAAAAGFAALGLYDDAAGAAGAAGAERGFAGHAGALAHGRLTTGGLKLVAGSALGFALAAPATDGFGFALAGGAVIALGANLCNALDLRPGRASKAWLIGAIPLAVAAGELRPLVCAAIGAVVASLPADLRERAMLGDAGANMLGALAGASAVLVAPRATLLVVLAGLALLTLIAEGPTLSRAIAAIAPIRAVDAWGRAPEPAGPPPEVQSGGELDLS